MASTLFADTFGNSVELTAAINRIPYNPGIVARLKQFTESGIPSTRAMAEFANHVLRLVQSAPRGGVADTHQSGTREGIEFSAIHLPTRCTVMADECQDQRAFGTTDLDSPLALRDSRLRGMKTNIELTLEHLRTGVLRGKVYDADGITVLLDIYAAFGIAQTSLSLDLNVSTTQILNRVIDAERASEDELGGNTPSGFIALSSPSFMDALRANPAYDTALRYGRPSDLLKDYRTGITVGNTTFLEVRSTPGLPTRIPDGEAYLIPQGIQDLLITRFAPADYMETVNTPGLPVYLKSEEMAFGKGYTLEAQSNPINFCSRPGAIIRLTAEAE